MKNKNINCSIYSNTNIEFVFLQMNGLMEIVNDVVTIMNGETETVIDNELDMCLEDDATSDGVERDICLLCGNVHFTNAGEEWYNEYDDNIFICNICDEKYHIMYCDDCEHICSCNGEIYNTHNGDEGVLILQGQHVNGGHICVRCYEKYRYCDECGISFREDNDEGIEDSNGCSYCNACIEKENIKCCESCRRAYSENDVDECPHCEDE